MAQGPSVIKEPGDGSTTARPDDPRGPVPHAPAPRARWLLPHRVSVPEPGPGFLERPDLAARVAPTARRLTLLIAPSGFGKTTLLAQGCRHAARDGSPAAWLSLDGDDGPDALDTYVAVAFEHAGIDLTPALRSADAGGGPRFPRTAVALRAVAELGTPCVLALDEAERVTDPDALALLNFLVHAAPPALHLAIACRELPPGLDVADPVLRADAAIVTSHDLRFSPEDTKAFLGDGLSAAQLREVVDTSAGWPVALRFQRNQGEVTPTGNERVARHLLDSWLQSRLWPTIPEEDRELVLAVGQFDWWDEALLTDVLDDPAAYTRMARMQQLDGLLEPGSTDGTAIMTLHPLLREHCVHMLRSHTPDRQVDVHRRIALALAARGDTVAAMRHAREAGDADLAADILLDAGGLRLGLREGYSRLEAAVRLLPPEASTRHPRLALAHCAAAATSGRVADARRILRRIPRVDPTQAAGDALDICADRCLARAIVANYGGESAASGDPHVLRDLLFFAQAPALEPLMRGVMSYSVGVAWHLHAAFDACLARCRSARVIDDSPFLTVSTYLYAGQTAMAQGNVADAVAWLGRGRELARARYLHDPRLAVAAEVFIRELELERCRFTGSAPSGSLEHMFRGLPLHAYFATVDVTVEHARATQGVHAAIKTLDTIAERARDTDRPALVRHLAATRVGLLADTGRVLEAQRDYESAALPTTDEQCTTLLSQGWREAEAASCARIRLLAAQDDRRGARRLANALVTASAERGARRTEMRGWALLAVVEHAGGDRGAARSALARFLDLYADTDYALPLAREAAAAALLEDFIDDGPVGTARRAAQGLLRTVVPAAADKPRLSARQAEVLARLTDRDQDIAAALGLSKGGVRYHVEGLFDKFGVKSRRAVMHRARALGLLPNR